MISTSFEMIIKGSSTAIVLGICLGVLYSLVSLVFKLKCHKKCFLIDNELNIGLGQNFFDFFFVLLSGILYLIIAYVFMDGANAFYPLCLLFLAFLLAKRIICSIIAKIFKFKK